MCNILFCIHTQYVIAHIYINDININIYKNQTDVHTLIVHIDMHTNKYTFCTEDFMESYLCYQESFQDSSGS